MGKKIQQRLKNIAKEISQKVEQKQRRKQQKKTKLEHQSKKIQHPNSINSRKRTQKIKGRKIDTILENFPELRDINFSLLDKNNYQEHHYEISEHWEKEEQHLQNSKGK